MSTEREQFEAWWEREGRTIPYPTNGRERKIFALAVWKGSSRAAASQPAQTERALHQSWYAHPAQAEPEFTDTARGALLWVLWHHQGGSSPVGQPIRFVLGMDAHERLSDEQVEQAKRWGELTGSVPGTCRAAQAEPQREALAEEAKRALDNALLRARHDAISKTDASMLTAVNARARVLSAIEALDRRSLNAALDRLAALPAPPVPTAPAGWNLERRDDTIIVTHPDIGGYAAREDGDTIASSVLYALAEALLAAAPQPTDKGAE